MDKYSEFEISTPAGRKSRIEPGFVLVGRALWPEVKPIECGITLRIGETHRVFLSDTAAAELIKELAAELAKSVKEKAKKPA